MPNPPYSYVTFTDVVASTGPFSYAGFLLLPDETVPEENQIVVKVDGVTKTLTTDYTVNTSTNQITFVAPITCDILRIERNTRKTSRYVDYTNGGNLGATDLDLDANQTFFIAQEAYDYAYDSMHKGSTDQWDAQSRRIQDVANPEASTDAVNKQYVDGLINGGEEQTATNVIRVKYSDLDDLTNAVNGINREFAVVTDEGVTIGDEVMVLAFIDGQFQTSTAYTLTTDGKGIIFNTAPSAGSVVELFLQTAAIPYIAEGGIDVDRLALTDEYFIVGGDCNCGEAVAKSAIPISGFGAATAAVNFGSQLLQSVATPVSGTDAANKTYVDTQVAAVTGLPTVITPTAYTLAAAVQNATGAPLLVIFSIMPGSSGTSYTYRLVYADDSGLSANLVSIGEFRSPSDAKHKGQLVGVIPTGKYYGIQQTEGTADGSLSILRSGAGE